MADDGDPVFTLPDDVTQQDDDSNSFDRRLRREAERIEDEQRETDSENSSQTVTPTRGSGSGGSRDTSGDSDPGGESGGDTDESTRRSTTTGISQTSRETSSPEPVADSDARRQTTTGIDQSSRETSQPDRPADSEARRQTTTGVDRSSRETRTNPDAALEQEARRIAAENVDVETQRGLEGQAGQSVTVDGQTLDVQDQAQNLEQRAIEKAEWADDESDVAVQVRDGRLVATPSRTAAIDTAASEIESDLRTDLEQRRRARDEEIEEAEEDLETASATFSLPDTVTFFGPGGQTTDVDVPFSDRELTVSGQTRDVELEETESGDVEVVTQERFGDFDLGIEQYTGAAGDRLTDAGERAGDVLARELVEERTVLPGAIIEKQVTGDTGFTASATRGAAEGVANLGDQALNLPQETAEFAVEGASRVASGEGRAFAGAVGGAAVGAGIQTGRAAARDPGRLTGQLAGSSIAATGGIAAATRLAGPRVGRAVSATVQPGEELAISAARSGAVPTRAATLVPGVSEGHIGQTNSGGGSSTSISGDSLGGLNVRERISSRTPNVRVEADPEAGVLEIDPELRMQVRESVTGPPRRAQERAVAAGAAARGAAVGGAQRAASAAREARARAGETVETIRDADLSTPDIRSAIRSGRRRARLDDSEFLADTRTRTRPGGINTPSIDAPSIGDLTPTTPGVQAVRNRLPESEFIADTRTGVTPSNIADPSVSTDVSRPSVRRGLARAGEGVDNFVASAQRGPPARGDIALQQALVGDGDLPTPNLDVSAPSPSIRAGVRNRAQRVGEGVDDFIINAQRGPAAQGDITLQQAFVGDGDLPTPSLGAGGGAPSVRAGVRRRVERVGEGVDDFIINAQRGPAARGDITLQQAFVGDGDLPTPSIDQAVRAGRRRGRAASDRLSDLSSSTRDAAVDVALRTPAHQGDITLQRAFVGDGDLPRPSRPSLDTPDVTGTVRREVTAARFRAAGAARQGQRFASDVSDVTIRVGNPPRPTLFETDVDDTTASFDAEDALGTELDTDSGADSGRSESDDQDDGDDPLDPARTGVGIETDIGSPATGQQFRIRSETRPEASMETATEPSFETEEEFTSGRGVGDALRVAEPSVDTGQQPDLDVEQEPGVTTESAQELDVGIESRLETRQEPGTETRVETRQETRQELRQELRTEAASEPSSELRSELSTEPLLRDTSGDRRRRRSSADFAREFEFGVASSEDVLSGESGVLDNS